MEQNTIDKKKSGVSQGELLAAAIIILSSVLMFWKTTDVRLSALELRMNGTEKINESIINKIDKVQESVNEVNLSLKDKVDRKN